MFLGVQGFVFSGFEAHALTRLSGLGLRFSVVRVQWPPFQGLGCRVVTAVGIPLNPFKP